MNGKRRKELVLTDIYDKIVSILEAFKDIGKLSPEQLRKGQRLNVNDPDNFTEVTGRVFYQAINQIRNNDIAKMNKGLPSKGLSTLSVYGVSDYMFFRQKQFFWILYSS